ESGGSDSFTVVLTSKPTAPVTISITSTATTHGTVSKSSLVFDDTDWFTPQTVVITGHDDGVVTADQPYTITTGAAVSGDNVYNGMDPPDVSVTSVGTPQVLLNRTSGLV